MKELSLALLPDDTQEAGARFRATAMTVSHWFSGVDPGEYELVKTPHLFHETHVHCALETLLVADASELGRLASSLDPWLGRRCVVTTSPLEVMPCARADLTGHADREASLYKVARFAVTLPVEAQEWPRSIEASLGAVLGRRVRAAFAANPQMIVWAARMERNNQIWPTTRMQAAQKSVDVPCRLVLGERGALGQLRKFVLSSRALSIFG
jgi:hypothetical protein